ncbi:MAG: hypothetical protein NXH95_05240 [Pseudomonadaceae bacterium]|nr:hypothetical protein [Pseudomonadaceae bacterium]
MRLVSATPLYLLSFFVTVNTTITASAFEFNQKLDLQIRADERSSNKIRYQYRARYYPSVTFTDALSVHAFAVTGDEFGSSHNTVNDGAADYLYIRRAYLRHEGNYGKTEAGVIPTYKGKVSSTGLSKDGWIQGIRFVRNMESNARLEMVVGQLESNDPADALGLPDEIDYLEMEYSADFNDETSFELSVEKMTQANFFRTELRHEFSAQYTGFAELVYRLDETARKVVIGIDTEFEMFGSATDVTALYAYVSDDFGERAELTEDFLGTGHGMTAELASGFGNSRWDWFVRYDGTEFRSRFIAGIKWSL